MKGHPSWMPGLAKLLVLQIGELPRRTSNALFIAAHNQHYTALLNRVHGIGQDVRKRTGCKPVAWSK
jgi:hypothetical protein